MTIAGLFSVLTFQVKNLQLRFVIGLYKIEHIIRRGNHLYGNPVYRDLGLKKAEGDEQSRPRLDQKLKHNLL